MSTRWQRLRGWLKAADLTLPVALVVLGVLIVGFLKLGDEVGDRSINAFDERILLALRAAPDDPLGPHWVEAGMMHFSALGSGAVTGLVTAIAVVFALLARRRHFAILIGGCAAGTSALMVALKGLYGRQRPTVVTHIDPPGGLSFPSGHSMISMALYMTLAVVIARSLPDRKQRRYVIGVGALLAFIIGVSRMYLGVHYPSDVLAGWTAGGAWAIVCGLIAYRLGRRREIEVPRPPPPTPPAT